MHKIIPVLTEKSLAMAADGEYTFWVDRNSNKHQIKELINTTFGVDVKRVRTINKKGVVKRNYLGKKKIIQPRKKAIVRLAEKQKIDLFDTE